MDFFIVFLMRFILNFLLFLGCFFVFELLEDFIDRFRKLVGIVLNESWYCDVIFYDFVYYSRIV